MLAPRWKKVLGDLKTNPTRTALVVLSIFIGVFAVGLITSAQAIIQREMRDAYVLARPANASLSVGDVDSFDDNLLETVRGMELVGEAEARRTYSVRVAVPGNWRDMAFVGIDDFDDVRIDKFTVMEGQAIPRDKQVLIERSGFAELDVAVGEYIWVERPDGRQRRVQVAGVVYAATEAPASFGPIRGYVDMTTMEWLSGETGFTQLLIRSAENSSNQEHNQMVAEEVYDKVRKSERDPSFPLVPVPDEHPLSQFIGGMVAIMSILGVMSVFLSAFLVVNTISALLAQQIKQIGIMKSVGARTGQIVGLYMVLVLCFGVLAFTLAFPLVQLSARVFSDLVADLFNFSLSNYSVPVGYIVLQAAISLLVPVLSAIVPVFSGTRVTIREALSSEGGAGSYGRGLFDRLIQHIRVLPRPLLLSLRNTFRRKGRVALTLVTLTLGGSIFISIFSVRDSLMLTVDDILSSLFNYDVQVILERDYRDDYVITEAERVPGVISAETWRTTGARPINPDDSEGESITIFAVPPDTTMMQPNIVAGRWLLEADQNAVVLSTGIFQDDPDIQIGDEIVLRIRGRDVTWQVVGEMPTIGGARWAYATYDAYGRAAREVGAAGQVLVRTEERDGEFQATVAETLDEHYSNLGINVVGTETLANIRAQQETFFNALISALLIMSVLIAMVGGLGLMGTMSLNVLERIREIGVMRAIGASDGTVLQIVMVEGVLLGVMSWLLSAALSLPISRLLSDTVGDQLFSFPLSFTFSTQGLVIWLVISITLSALASFLPAWNASRVTVRDVLAYE